jgi:flagellar biosynthesis/type III secretory pathway chaperone
VNSNLNSLEKVFKEEISIYNNLVILETSKKEAILRSNAKHLENFTKQTTQVMENLKSLEEERVKLVQEIIPSNSDLSLSNFLESLDKNDQIIFKPLSESLKQAVFTLKEKISLNEELLKSKLEIFSLSLEALKSASEPVPTEFYGEQGKSKSRTNIMLNKMA